MAVTAAHPALAPGQYFSVVRNFSETEAAITIMDPDGSVAGPWSLPLWTTFALLSGENVAQARPKRATPALPSSAPLVEALGAATPPKPAVDPFEYLCATPEKSAKTGMAAASASTWRPLDEEFQQEQKPAASGEGNENQKEDGTESQIDDAKKGDNEDEPEEEDESGIQIQS